MTRTVVRWRLLRALVAPPLYFGLVVAGLGALTWSGAGWSVQDLALTLVIGPFIAVMVSLWLVARVSHDAPSGRRPSDWVLALLAIAQAVIVIGASLLGLTWLVSGD